MGSEVGYVSRAGSFLPSAPRPPLTATPLICGRSRYLNNPDARQVENELSEGMTQVGDLTVQPTPFARPAVEQNEGVHVYELRSSVKP